MSLQSDIDEASQVFRAVQQEYLRARLEHGIESNVTLVLRKRRDAAQKALDDLNEQEKRLPSWKLQVTFDAFVQEQIFSGIGARERAFAVLQVWIGSRTEAAEVFISLMRI